MLLTQKGDDTNNIFFRSRALLLFFMLFDLNSFHGFVVLVLVFVVQKKGTQERKRRQVIEEIDDR